MLDGEGLVAEFVAPRLWEHGKGIDGGYTANDPACRKWAVERTLRTVDIAGALGTKLLVFWLAREGTYIRESKNALDSHKYLINALNQVLRYDPQITIAIEPKPNEPMDHAYIPTIGHALAMATRTDDPTRVGGLIETAHALLAGLDPSDEMAFALPGQALERTPERSERLEIRSGQDLWRRQSPRGLQPGPHPGVGWICGERPLRRAGREGNAEPKGGRCRPAPHQQPHGVLAACRESPHVSQGYREAVRCVAGLRIAGISGARTPDGPVSASRRGTGEFFGLVA